MSAKRRSDGLTDEGLLPVPSKEPMNAIDFAILDSVRPWSISPIPSVRRKGLLPPIGLVCAFMYSLSLTRHLISPG